jgi:hypothetical protein
MRDIAHRGDKDIDYYFFGMLSERRQRVLRELKAAGLKGAADNSCPYFLRNDRIARAKLQLNLVQDDKYTHVNGFRICYLADNACCILTEKEIDPANYLKYAETVPSSDLVSAAVELTAGDRWKQRAARAQADFEEFSMNELMQELLDKSFAGTR